MSAFVEKFFPTAVYCYEDVDMANRMLPLSKKYLYDPNFASTHLNYRSTYRTDKSLSAYQEFDEFKNFIFHHVSCYHEIQGYSSMQFRDISIFTSEMKKGDSHSSHAHPNASYACVFYLEMPRGSSPIIFNDPRPHHKFVKKKPAATTIYNASQHTIMPRKGLLLIWDAWIEHEVPVNDCEDGRITLVCNVA